MPGNLSIKPQQTLKWPKENPNDGKFAEPLSLQPTTLNSMSQNPYFKNVISKSNLISI